MAIDGNQADWREKGFKAGRFDFWLFLRLVLAVVPCRTFPGLREELELGRAAWGSHRVFAYRVASLYLYVSGLLDVLKPLLPVRFLLPVAFFSPSSP